MFSAITYIMLLNTTDSYRVLYTRGLALLSKLWQALAEWHHVQEFFESMTYDPMAWK